MKTIKYADYKKQETLYKQIKGTYNKEDKTIQVEDRKILEFDFRFVKDYKDLHIKLIIKNTNSENPRMYFCYKDYYSYYSIQEMIYEHNKEYIDGVMKDKGYEITDGMSAREESKCIKFKRQILNTLSIFEGLEYSTFEKMIGKSVLNLKEYNPDEVEEVKEVEEEKPMKIVTMRYFDYKKTKFKKVPDSYDNRKNTIDVYVPEDYKLPEMQIVEVDYDDYKKQFKNKFEQIYGSYNNKNHTVKIRVPMDFEYDFPSFNKVTMLFKDYKKSYSKYRTIGSYNDKDGTIKVLLPEGVEYVRNEKDEHYEEIHAFKKGYTDEVTITPKKLNIADFNVEVPECLKN